MGFLPARGRTLTGLTGLLCLAALSACGVAGDGAAADPGSPVTAASSGAVPTPTTTTSAPEIVPAGLAVPAPGPRTGAVTGSDMLVFDKVPLAAGIVQQLEHLTGVQSAAPISLAQVSIENKVYNVAAVDPSTYRNFTPVQSADLQAQWDRVAGGELAVSAELRKQLPIDPQGYLTLDVDGSQQKVHVGAYAPQAGAIDMVVNDKLGAALGMQQGNAMLLSTGEASPQSLRAPIGRIVGSQISVQNLDAVAKYGLDPQAIQSAVFVGPFSDAVGVYNYTPTGGGRVAPDSSWVSAHIATEVVPILGAVTCNKDLFPQLKAALQQVIMEHLESAIHPTQYGGCYVPRFIAGSTTLSNHSFGLAIDLNVPENERGTVGQMDRGVVAIFKYWGFAWGGDWHYTDPMHFELSELRRPG